MLSCSNGTKNWSWNSDTKSQKTESITNSSRYKAKCVYDSLESKSSSGRTDINVKLNPKNKYDYDNKASIYRINNGSDLYLSSVTSSINS